VLAHRSDPATSIISPRETTSKLEGPFCSLTAKRPRISVTPHYRSSAKEPKKLLCAPETLTSLHVALDFHGYISFRSVLRSSLAGEELRILRRTSSEGRKLALPAFFICLAVSG